MAEVKHTEGQWPNSICSGDIRYGLASNYDGFYLADASHGIPTFGSVSGGNPVTIRGQHVHIFNYPGQTEEIAKQLVHRWNSYNEMLAILKDIKDFLQRSGYDTTMVKAVIAKASPPTREEGGRDDA